MGNAGYGHAHPYDNAKCGKAKPNGKGRGSWRKRAKIKRQLAATERVCWLCLDPLDFAVADWRSPEYVVIDEELPVSKGGDPLDIRNCHLVHNRCNGRKGNRVLGRGAFAGGPRAHAPTSTSRAW